MNKFALRFTLAFAAATVFAACGPTVPKINSLRLGKDKDLSKETTTFAPMDTIFGEAAISTPGKASIKWMVFVDKVEGFTDNAHIPNADATVELPSSGTSTYHFPPGEGFPVGKYRVEVHMLDEGGAEKDTKSVTYTVAK